MSSNTAPLLPSPAPASFTSYPSLPSSSSSSPSQHLNWPVGFPASCFPFFHLPPELRERILRLALRTEWNPFCDDLFVGWWRRECMCVEWRGNLWKHTGGVDLGFTRRVASTRRRRVVGTAGRVTNTGFWDEGFGDEEGGEGMEMRRYFVLPPNRDSSRSGGGVGGEGGGGEGEGWTYALPRKNEKWTRSEVEAVARAGGWKKRLPWRFRRPDQNHVSRDKLFGMRQRQGCRRIGGDEDSSEGEEEDGCQDVEEAGLRRQRTPTNVYLASKQLCKEAIPAFWGCNVLVLNLVDKGVRARWAGPSSSSSHQLTRNHRHLPATPSSVPPGAKLRIRSLCLVFKRMGGDVSAIVDEIGDMILRGCLRELDVRFEDGGGSRWVPGRGQSMPGSAGEELVQPDQDEEGDGHGDEENQKVPRPWPWPRPTDFPINHCAVMRKIAKTLADPDLTNRRVWVSRRHRGGWCGLHEPLPTPFSSAEEGPSRIAGTSSSSLSSLSSLSISSSLPSRRQGAGGGAAAEKKQRRQKCKMLVDSLMPGYAIITMDAGPFPSPPASSSSAGGHLQQNNSARNGNTDSREQKDDDDEEEQERRAWLPVDWKRFVRAFGRPEECEIFRVREGWMW